MIPRIKISFSLHGDCEEIEQISNKLQIKEAKIKRKKDFAASTYAEDFWTLEIGYIESSDVSILTDKIYARLHDSIPRIKQIKKESSLKSIVVVVIQADVNRTPIISLNKNIIKLAYETESEIHFDNYFYDN